MGLESCYQSYKVGLISQQNQERLMQAHSKERFMMVQGKDCLIRVQGFIVILIANFGDPNYFDLSLSEDLGRLDSPQNRWRLVLLVNKLA